MRNHKWKVRNLIHLNVKVFLTRMECRSLIRNMEYFGFVAIEITCNFRELNLNIYKEHVKVNSLENIDVIIKYET